MSNAYQDGAPQAERAGSAEKPTFIMRSVCECGSVEGTITETGAQDVVRCTICNRFQYNAPRTETGKAVRSMKTTHEAISTKRRAEILSRATWHCELCGRRPSNGSELNVGHMLSVADGHGLGLSDADINCDENLASMCSECNAGLGRQTVPARLLVSVIMARIGKGRKK